jgi:hypothetical protein
LLFFQFTSTTVKSFRKLFPVKSFVPPARYTLGRTFFNVESEFSAANRAFQLKLISVPRIITSESIVVLTFLVHIIPDIVHRFRSNIDYVLGINVSTGAIEINIKWLLFVTKLFQLAAFVLWKLL